jgi:hypothetical protein
VRERIGKAEARVHNKISTLPVPEPATKENSNFASWAASRFDAPVRGPCPRQALTLRTSWWPVSLPC